MAIAAISSGENKFETLERMLHSPTVTVNNDVEIKLNNLSPRALRYMLTKELNIEKLVEEQKKIKLNSTLLDKIINDKTTQTKKAKFSDITGFSLRPLTDAENIKFELDTLKTYYIITRISCGSVASIVGFKVGDIIIGMFNTDGFHYQIFDYNDEDALYNVNGNHSMDDKTILYISIRVIRYISNFSILKLNYTDILIIPFDRPYHLNQNVLHHHSKRFIIPYDNLTRPPNNNINNTLVRFGSFKFEQYIDELTNKKQVGGARVVSLLARPGPRVVSLLARVPPPLIIVASIFSGILPNAIPGEVSEERILLMNLFLNEIFKTILVNNKLKKDALQQKISFVPIYIQKKYMSTESRYNLHSYPEINDDDDEIIVNKLNLLLDQDKKLIFETCYEYESGERVGGYKNKYKVSKNLIRRRKQKTIKKKIRNIKNKNSVKNKINKKINKKINEKIKKYAEKYVKNNIKQQKQQEKIKYRIKKLLESKIHEKINKLKLNKTKYWNKNKSNRRKNTRKNYL
jgi:hypothetical protein